MNPTLPAEWVDSKVFASDVWLEEDTKIQIAHIHPSKPEQDLPQVIIPQLIWGGTRLGQSTFPLGTSQNLNGCPKFSEKEIVQVPRTMWNIDLDSRREVLSRS